MTKVRGSRRLVVFGPGHPFRGGIAQTTTALVSALEDLGHDVLFLSARRQYPGWLYPGVSDRDPAACKRLECAAAVVDPMAPWTWPATRRRAVEFEAVTWIVPYWTWVWAPWWRFLLSGSRRPPVVAVVHNPHDHDGEAVHRIAARAVLTRCQALFTHAEHLRQRLVEEFPGIPSASHLLPPVTNGSVASRQQAREALGLPSDRPIAVFWGLIRPYKGVDLLLEACAKLPPRSRWHVIVAGEPWGGVEPELRRKADELGLEDRVDLRMGWVSEEEVDLLLGAADVVVLPYRAGSQSAVAPRALAAGRPILTTRVGGLPEMVRDGVEGLVVEPDSVDALANGLNRLEDPALRERLSAGAAASAARLTWASYAESLVTLVNGIV
jgi:glycosyltransferase involved in cell wall biosynthesis